MTKQLTVLLLVAMLPLGLWAQDGSFNAPQTGHVVTVKKGEAEAAERLRPRSTGVVIMMSEKGLQVISPLAPASAGSGVQNLTAGHALEKRQASAVEDPKPYGGVILYGWVF